MKKENTFTGLSSIHFLLNLQIISIKSTKGGFILSGIFMNQGNYLGRCFKAIRPFHFTGCWLTKRNIDRIW